MNKIVLSPSFISAYKKFVKRFPFLQNRIDECIKLLEVNIYNTKLHTHKLSGDLLGCFACSCGYDCRIVFNTKLDRITQENVILLISIGTHDEVY
jgi:mRNA-degrading endonuclease YafQ of YafQ-DinJ toxin-antitoxin module